MPERAETPTSSQPRPVLVVCALIAQALSCGKGPGGDAKRIPRDKDAAAVVVVDSPRTEKVTFIDESEPNDQLVQAKILAPGTGVRGTLSSPSDVDLYAVNVAQDGFLVAHVSGADDADLILEVRDFRGEPIVRSDRGPARTSEGAPNYPVEQGTYHLAVLEFVKKARRPRKGDPGPRAGPSAPYQLTARVIAAVEPGHEVEPNREPDLAAEVLISDPVHGYYGWNRDVDVWKLSVEGFTSTYSLDLDVSAVPGVTPTLTVFDRDREPVAVLAGRQGVGLSLRNLVVASSPDGAGAQDDDHDEDVQAGEKPGEKLDEAAPGGSYYYAELRARRSNPEDPYRLEMKTRLLDVDEEVEPNDEAVAAVPLRDSPRVTFGDKTGYLTLGDTDHYRLAGVEAAVLLSVTARPAGDADLTVEVLVDGGVVAMQDAGKAGKTETLADVRVEAGTEAVVRITGRGSLGDDARYELSWALDPAPAPEPAPVAAPPDDDTGSPGDDPASPGDYEDE